MRKIITNESKRTESLNAVFEQCIKKLSISLNKKGGFLNTNSNNDRVSSKKILDTLKEPFSKDGFSFEERVTETKYTKGIGNNEAWLIRDQQSEDFEIVGALKLTNNMFGAIITSIMEPIDYKSISNVYTVYPDRVEKKWKAKAFLFL